MPFFLALIFSISLFSAPNGYVCLRAKEPIRIDGRIDSQWKDAPWTSFFVDIEGDAKPKPRYRTRARMLWDDDFFYVAADLEEPHIWGTLTAHDSVIFHDNDFEVFVDPNSDSHEYFEFEINALNTGWDLFLPKPYKDGGKADNGWEIPGLRTAVHVRGSLNDASDRDEGWSVEIAIPWKAFGKEARTSLPPKPSDIWRVNFSRVEWQHKVSSGKYARVKGTKEDNWVWSPQGKVNMHLPEHWGYVRFSPKASGTEELPADPQWGPRMSLQSYYQQQFDFRKKENRWANARELPPGHGMQLRHLPDGTWRACLDGLCIRSDAKIERD